MRSASAFCLLAFFVTTCGVSAADAPRSLSSEAIAARFKQLDKDGDGELRGDELASPPWLRMLDADGNGGVTMAEAESVLSRFRKPAQPEQPPTSSSAPISPAESSPRQAPRRLNASEAGIGKRLPEAWLADTSGGNHPLAEFKGNNGLIIALVSPDCPVSKRYIPTLAQLQTDASEKEVGLLLIAPLADDGKSLRKTIGDAGITAPVFADPKGAVARALGARATTDAFLFDAAQTLVYHGAIDDQYGLGYQLEAPRERYLTDAIASVLSRSIPKVVATEAPGCELDLANAPEIKTAATYHNRISRIVQANCLECHRSGGVAPFALETYEQVSAKAGMIRRMVSRNLMPPWFAAPVKEGEHSPWMNDRSLSEQDKADLLAWIEAGKPEGNPEQAPLPRETSGEWQIGTPDLVVQIPKPIEVKATGIMPYQYSNIELTLTEDKWVRGVEVRPTAREVVHHVLVFVQEKGKPLRQDGQLGGFFAAYVPGNSAVVYPDGFAKPLPAGSKLIFQIHYTPNGTATTDQVRVGMLFAKEPPQHVVRVTGIGNHRINIPPGADNHAESASIPVPRPVRLLGFMPHMHVRGKAFRYEATLPDGSTQVLLDVPRYDFNWQLAYRYAEPMTLPAGSQVKATGWFDNSSNNPANPDPTKAVRWGEQTSDEMLLGYVEYFYSDEDVRAAR